MAEAGTVVTRKGPGLDGVLERLRDLAQHSATVGYQGSSGAAKAGDADISVAQLAAIHEYGHGHVPSRPFMRRGARKAKGDVGRVAAEVVRKVVDDKAKPVEAMKRVGEVVGDAVKRELATAASWGGSPLVDDDRSLERGLTVAVRKGDAIVGSEERP